MTAQSVFFSHVLIWWCGGCVAASAEAIPVQLYIPSGADMQYCCSIKDWIFDITRKELKFKSLFISSIIAGWFEFFPQLFIFYFNHPDLPEHPLQPLCAPRPHLAKPRLFSTPFRADGSTVENSWTVTHPVMSIARNASSVWRKFSEVIKIEILYTRLATSNSSLHLTFQFCRHTSSYLLLHLMLPLLVAVTNFPTLNLSTTCHSCILLDLDNFFLIGHLAYKSQPVFGAGLYDMGEGDLPALPASKQKRSKAEGGSVWRVNML